MPIIGTCQWCGRNRTDDDTFCSGCDFCFECEKRECVCNPPNTASTGELMLDNRPLSVKNPDTVRSELLRLNMDARMKWREIAALEQYSSIPPGTLCSIAKGAPIPKKYRKQLGVILPIPVIPCEVCGEVHLHKHGEQTYDPATSALYNPSAQVVKPMPKPRKPSKPKIAIRKDDVRSAARTILRHYNKEDVAELAALLTK